ncbi:hypothetical protein BF49_6570 [Bradyrhizobium sp.]|nr:hypothetical protein BF49_6570 [Bradyrhizobium sp.]
MPVRGRRFSPELATHDELECHACDTFVQAMVISNGSHSAHGCLVREPK